MGRTACTEPQCLYSRAIPLLPLWVIQPVQSLSACTSVHFTLLEQKIRNGQGARVNALPTLPYCTILYSNFLLSKLLYSSHSGKEKQLDIKCTFLPLTLQVHKNILLTHFWCCTVVVGYVSIVLKKLAELHVSQRKALFWRNLLNCMFLSAKHCFEGTCWTACFSAQSIVLKELAELHVSQRKALFWRNLLNCMFLSAEKMHT
jgi:hypothetical protein